MGRAGAKTLAELVAAHVAVLGECDCWPWQAARSSSGYGLINYGAKNERRRTSAHRAAWQIANGPIPSGLWVLHKCDNPPCCNPAHLYLGTHADNMADKVNRGRVRGERNPKARFNEVAVRVVRFLYARGIGYRRLARAHGCDRTVIRDIIHGETWSHLK